MCILSLDSCKIYSILETVFSIVAVHKLAGGNISDMVAFTLTFALLR